MIAEAAKKIEPMEVRPGNDNRQKARLPEIIAVASIAIVLLILALALSPARTGDGQYYFAMLDALARNGSPEITEQTINTVKNQLGTDITNGMLQASRSGAIYAWHFFFYSLLCVPFYKLLGALNLEALKSFQLTNALIISFVLAYILVFSRLVNPARWVIALGFLFSTATLYFQWTHPEVFTAALVLAASVGMLNRNYSIAALCAATASLQNPSTALFVAAIFLAQALDLRAVDLPRLTSWQAARAFGAIAVSSAVALVPYGWNHYQFGEWNPIVSAGFIDYSNISVARLISFLFDLNQGLIVGMPLFLWTVPILFMSRCGDAFSRSDSFFKREDLLLVGFLFMAVPTLAQANWNSDASVFIRYASWAGMAPLVWIAVLLSKSRTTWMLLGIVPGLILQAAMALWVGGISVPRQPRYVEFMPWVAPIWEFNPRIYNPLPEIYFERLLGNEVPIFTPATFKNSDGVMVRALTKQNNIQAASKEICGPDGIFMPENGNSNSTPRIRKTEKGFYYVTGRFDCLLTIPSILSGASGGSLTRVLGSGWSHPENWGVWTDGPRAAIRFRAASARAGKINISIAGQAFVTEHNPEQKIEVLLGGRLVDTWVARYPDHSIEKMLVTDAEQFNRPGGMLMELRLPDARAPSEVNSSSDARKLGFGLKEIRLGYSEPQG